MRCLIDFQSSTLSWNSAARYGYRCASKERRCLLGVNFRTSISTPSVDATFTLAIPAIALGRSSGFQESCLFAEADEPAAKSTCDFGLVTAVDRIGPILHAACST